MTEPCSCSDAGWCERHQQEKSPADHLRCQESLALRKILDTRVEWSKPRVSKVDLLQCVHRGDETGELKTCQTCRGSTQIKVFVCAIHGSCTIVRRFHEIACCNKCSDRNKTMRTPA